MTDKPNTLSEETSIYLDFLRLVAAIDVFISHSNNFLFPYLSIGLLASGREAVAIFFILSGFVINFVVTNKEFGWRKYAIARISRIYPVAIIAIIATLVLDFAGRAINPQHYDYLNTLLKGFMVRENLESFFRYLTFTNQFWFSHTVFGSDEPYWSLGFEVPYYVAFGLFSFFPGKYRIPVTAIWMLICGPKIALYFPLWLMGALAYRITQRRPIRSPRVGVILFVVSIFGLLLLRRLVSHIATDMYHPYDLSQEINNFIYVMLLGSFLSLNIISFDAAFGGRFNVGGWMKRTIRWAAGRSFTLYLVHQPMLVFVSGLFVVGAGNVPGSVAALLGVLLAVWALAELGEVNKKFYAKWVDKMLPGRPG
jgi:peptidoglycan/LPS O-acetylase OafA/YrhL